MPSMAAVSLDNVQGDLFSRGFPKINEMYYFFTIAPNKERDFSKALAILGSSGKIATLKTVLDDWRRIDANPTDVIPMANALIAFSKKGLDKVNMLTSAPFPMLT